MKRTAHRLSVVSVMTAFCMVISSCTVDTDKLKDGLDDLKDSISDEEETNEETEVTNPMPIASDETAPEEEQETSETEEYVPDETEIVTPTPTSAPTATPTPTEIPSPTPTPSPERVDFSELTETDLTDLIKAESESFSESYITEDGLTLATMSGDRLLLDAGVENVTAAVNLILDGFYSEADGAYARCIAEARAELSLDGMMPDQTEEADEENDEVEDDDDNERDDRQDKPFEQYDVRISYAYSDNGRVLSVIMTYTVARGEETINSSTEYASFDMLTGQYVTIASTAEDYDGFKKALADALADSVDEDTEVEECEVSFIACQAPGATTATAEIYGKVNGETAHTTVDLNNFAEYLNRYGRTVYGVI